MLLIACQKIPARSSEASVYVVQDYDGCSRTLGLLEVRTATGSGRARGRTVCFAPWGLPMVRQPRMGRGRKLGGEGRPGGLFSLCRSGVRVVVGRCLSGARANEPQVERSDVTAELNFSGEKASFLYGEKEKKKPLAARSVCLLLNFNSWCSVAWTSSSKWIFLLRGKAEHGYE